MERSADLREVTLQLYQAMATGDVGYFERHAARREGVLGIGSDPQEWWVVHETLLRAWWAQLREVGGSFPVTPGAVWQLVPFHLSVAVAK